jgi:hypothetical protein
MRRFFFLFLYLWVLFAMFVLNEGTVLRAHRDWRHCTVLAPAPLIYPILRSFPSVDPVHCFSRRRKGHRRPHPRQGDCDSAPSIGGGGLVGRVSAAAIIFVALVRSSASGTSASSSARTS